MAFHHRPCPLPSALEPEAGRGGQLGYILMPLDAPCVVSARRAVQEQRGTRCLKIVLLNLAFRRDLGPGFRNILLDCTLAQEGALTRLKILRLELGDHWQCLPLLEEGSIA
jgi:hypothetical protein